MNASDVRRGVVVGALLALSAFAAAASELRAMSESEMSDVHGRGVADAAAFGALTAQEQSGSYASAGDAQAALVALSSDSTKNLERQLAQQQLQTATTGLQATIRMAQTLATASQILAPVATTLPMLPFLFMPGLGALPVLPNNGSSSSGNKH